MSKTPYVPGVNMSKVVKIEDITQEGNLPKKFGIKTQTSNGHNLSGSVTIQSIEPSNLKNWYKIVILSSSNEKKDAMIQYSAPFLLLHDEEKGGQLVPYQDFGLGGGSKRRRSRKHKKTHRKRR